MTDRAHKLRRVPLQDRSRRRLEAIVDAAAELFAGQGFETTTVEAIAAAAQTSVGSVYQFFDNKVALFRAVAERAFERIREGHAALIASDLGEGGIDALIDAVVDGFAVLVRTEASVRAVWSNVQLYGEVEDGDLALERELVARSEAILAAHLPALSSAERAGAARLMVQTIGAGLLACQRLDAAAADQLLAELKLMLRAYAAELAARSGGAAPGGV